uniref:glucose-6-phosphatase n=1 Tax=Ceratitis capitata TaxID=7213 RepID=W8BZ15_CERCA
MDFISDLSGNMTEYVCILLPQIYHEDLLIVEKVQKQMRDYQWLLLLLSEHFSAAKIMDYYVPLLGAFRHDLMVLLVTLLACVNTLTSLIKWVMPANRPYWWVHESDDNYKIFLHQYRGSCETTGAFPSSHCIAMVTFSYVLIFQIEWRHKWSSTFRTFVRVLLVVLVSILVALSRIYLATQFASHCLLTGLLLIGVIMLYERHANIFYSLSQLKAVLITCCLSLLPVFVYFSMKRVGLDPHWSVRMAFKWCIDPEYMRHEDSSIFILGRDFGYLMGVMMSMPLRGSHERRIKMKRFPLIFALEILNYYARLETPKTYGRVAFVAYEFLRNATHSFTLLTILPKITTKPRVEYYFFRAILPHYK